jgi:hypothetical protein
MGFDHGVRTALYASTEQIWDPIEHRFTDVAGFALRSMPGWQASATRRRVSTTFYGCYVKLM